ncbi:MAG: deoxyribodipyrimidine photo-lyase, partial [Rhodospirillaceae bacterium]|nr:deoxyribodipyrimidine photo-lyase [Rhodospirillaceae bacterium]
AACRAGAVVPVFILEEGGEGAPRRLGGALRWWLAGSLAALSNELAARGARLILRRGDPAAVLGELAAATKATSVHWNRRYDPAGAARDGDVEQALTGRGLEVETFNAGLLAEPWEISTGSGRPYQVFKPFWVALRNRIAGVVAEAAPPAIPAPERWPESDALDAWGLLPTRPDWAGGLRAAWVPGEAAAQALLAAFLDGPILDYQDRRDLPGEAATARLSPHLHWGEIGPRQIWAAATGRFAGSGDAERAGAFLRQLAWREFCCHLLHHFPRLPDANLQAKFDAMAWTDDAEALAAWQRGQTGYPIVDAGMRELWATGWMHNRVRMVVASFLTKHLLIHWRHGEAWFWDTLVDADLANNVANWQWVAGCGADAAPFFRIFNPVLQGQKFDPHGAYVRRWVPELAELDDGHLHEPWRAPPMVLRAAGIVLGRDYPPPMVDHKRARQRALDALHALPGTA